MWKSLCLFYIPRRKLSINLRNLNNIYLYYYLSFIENKAKEIGQQGTQSNLSKQIVEKFKLQLPTIKEQQTIATVLSSIDKEIESLEGKKAKYEETSRRRCASTKPF